MTLRPRTLLMAVPVAAVFAVLPLCVCLHALAWDHPGPAVSGDLHHGMHEGERQELASPCADACPHCGAPPQAGAVPSVEDAALRTAGSSPAPEPDASAERAPADAGRWHRHERLAWRPPDLPTGTQVSLHVRLLN